MIKGKSAQRKDVDDCLGQLANCVCRGEHAFAFSGRVVSLLRQLERAPEPRLRVALIAELLINFQSAIAVELVDDFCDKYFIKLYGLKTGLDIDTP